MNIGETIQKLRKERKMTQTEFANKIEITQTSLSQIESGKTRPHKQTLKKIAEELNVPEVLLYLLSMEEEDVPEEKRVLYSTIGPTIKALAEKLMSNESE